MSDIPDHLIPDGPSRIGGKTKYEDEIGGAIFPAPATRSGPCATGVTNRKASISALTPKRTTPGECVSCVGSGAGHPLSPIPNDTQINVYIE
jgi:hypothetical protein